MRSLAKLRVEWVAERLCPPSGKPEVGLPQRLRFHRRDFFVFFAAIFLAFSMPAVAAQQPASQPGPPADTALPNASTPVQPSLPASGGCTQEQQLLAKQQGKADTAVLDWVLANSGELKGDMWAGELRIAFTVTPAEGWWDKAGGNALAWHEAPANNVHLRIFVLSLTDGRMVPGLKLRATLTDANGNEQSVPVDFGWYPLMNAYGGNFPLDADSSYTLRVSVDSEGIEHSTIAEFPPVAIAQDAVARLPLATDIAFANEAELLKPCNAALAAAITALWKDSVSGLEEPAGDYFVGYALDYSGLAMPIGGAKLRPKNLIELTGKDNVLLTLLIRDSRTGRLIPGLKPQASLIAADGKLYGPGELPLVTHAWLYHYGRITRIPRKGLYKLRVHVDAPGFRRWGKQSERFASPAEVEFDDVGLLQPGKQE